MKQANKFMVVPYSAKEITEIKTSDNKISEILNNKNIDKSDKVKLINQFLARKENKWPKSDEIISFDNDETFDQTFDETSKVGAANSFADDNIFNDPIEKSEESFIDKKKEKKKIVLTTKTKKEKKIEQNISLLNKKINQLNNTVNNAQLFLPPANSTRLAKKEILNPINFSKEAIEASLKAFKEGEHKDQIKISEKLANKLLAKHHKSNKKKPYDIPLANIEIKKPVANIEIKKPAEEQMQIGSGLWSIYR
jgi:hypothetical protein